MSTKLFGQFLLEKGYVTREQLLHGLAEQRAVTGTLGDLAVAVGMITMEQLEAIHRRQDSAGEPFSMAAVRLGHLSEPQIAQLLHPQSAERLLLGQILLAFGYLDKATLQDALKAHTTERDEDDFALMRAFRQSGLVEVGPTCTSVLRGVFKQSFGGGLSFQAIPPVKAVSAGQAVWSQGISQGEDRFILGLQMPADEARVVAGAVLGTAVKEFDDLARDAVGEFLNLVTGHVCANLRSTRVSTWATPPLVHRPETFLSGARPGVALLCTSEEIQFTYMVARPLSTARVARQKWAASAVVA